MTNESSPPIQFLCAQGLGDAVLTMAMAERARDLGHASVVYSNALLPTAALYPNHTIEPTPLGESLQAIVHSSGRVFVGSKSYVSAEADLPPNDQRILYRKRYGNRTVHHLASLSARMIQAWGFGLEEPYTSGINAPPNWDTRRANVIAIHPMSAHKVKDWRMTGYRRLSNRLADDGFDVEWIAAHEQVDALKSALGADINVAPTPTLMDLARVLASVRALVAVDSGVGHLASALGTPTLSIFRKQSSACYWRPAFAPGEVVAPRFSLPTRMGVKQWKFNLSALRVHRALHRLLHRV